MSFKFLLLSILITFIFIGCNNNESEVVKYKSELDNHANMYMKELKSVLIANMKEGGPYQAVNVCSDTAARLTVDFSENKGVVVKRISFKNRNVHNFPKPKEVDILKNFESQFNEKKLDKNSYVIVENVIDGKRAVTFAKPIFIEAPCLNCHGNDNQLSSDVKEILSEKYPADKAKGYKIGDLRGAITVSKVL